MVHGCSPIRVTIGSNALRSQVAVDDAGLVKAFARAVRNVRVEIEQLEPSRRAMMRK